MCEVACDWNYANTGIYDESAFIYRARLVRKFIGVQLAAAAALLLQQTSERYQGVRICVEEQHEKT